MNKVSLNDAFLVRSISEGPMCNRCHVTAIDIIDRRTPNLNPEVFCCKIWSKIISYLDKHEIWPKYGILSQWWLHTQSKKHQKLCLQYSPPVEDTLCVTFGLNHWMKACVKPNNMVMPILIIHCPNRIFRKLLSALNIKNIAILF